MSKWCSKDQSSQQTTFSTYVTSEEHMHIWESEASTSCLWDNRKVPKLAGLHRTFPASIQQSWSTGVKTRGQSSFWPSDKLIKEEWENTDEDV